jgi:hypothetical protein
MLVSQAVGGVYSRGVLLQIVLQDQANISITTQAISPRGLWPRLLTSFGGRATEYSGMGHGVYVGSYSMMTSLSTSSPDIRDESSSLVYS